LSDLHSQAAIDRTHASLKTFGEKANYRLENAEQDLRIYRLFGQELARLTVVNSD
jgi:hypothetical protein